MCLSLGFLHQSPDLAFGSAFLWQIVLLSSTFNAAYKLPRLDSLSLDVCRPSLNLTSEKTGGCEKR